MTGTVTVEVTETTNTVEVDDGTTVEVTNETVSLVDVGTQGPAGVGVPTGGTAGQALRKSSDADYDTEWGSAIESVVAGINISVDNTDPFNPVINSLSDRYKTTSDTSNTIAHPATLTFTVGANLAYVSQQEVLIVYDADNHMHGTVVSYSGTTLIVDIKHKTGSGTYASWGINLDGTPVDAITGEGVANQIAYFTSPQVIASLPTATYPNLTELSYVKGATSGIQTQLNAKQATITGAATTITSSNLTPSRALASDAGGKVAESAVTSTELGYLSGSTSSIQNQLNGKINSSLLSAQGDLIYASAANTPARLAKNTSATRYLSNTGTSNNPAWAQVNLANGVTGNLPVSRLNSGISAYYGQYWDGSGQWLPLPSGSGGTLYDVLNAGNDTYGQSIYISGGGALGISCGGYLYGNGMYVCASGSQWSLDYAQIYNQYGAIYTSYVCAESAYFGCGTFYSLSGSEIDCYQYKSYGYYGMTGTLYLSSATAIEVHGGIITNWY